MAPSLLLLRLFTIRFTRRLTISFTIRFTTRFTIRFTTRANGRTNNLQNINKLWTVGQVFYRNGNTPRKTTTICSTDQGAVCSY